MINCSLCFCYIISTDVKVFHEAQAEAISHHASDSSQIDEYDYDNN